MFETKSCNHFRAFKPAKKKLSTATILLGASLLVGTILQPATTHAEELDLRAAQTYLNILGYPVGKPDGVWGKKSAAALSGFLRDRNRATDAELTPAILTRLQQASTGTKIKLNHPGRLFDRGQMPKACITLKAKGRHPKKVALEFYKPIIAFNDSNSIGDSIQEDQARRYTRVLLHYAAFARAQNDQDYAEGAKTLLLNWANVGAGLKTRLDFRYLGKGAGKSYKANARAPILDVENAAQLGYGALYATEMLEPFLTEAEKKKLTGWASKLISKYARPLTNRFLKEGAKGVWRSLSMSVPTMALAIEQRDEKTFRRIAKYNIRFIGKHIDKRGAILKNMHRGNRALHYQSIGLIAIASFMDMMEDQGIELPGSLHDKLHRAVNFFLKGEANHKSIYSYAKRGYNNDGYGRKQLVHYRDGKEHAWWMLYYIGRYPNHPNANLLRHFLVKNTGQRYAVELLDAHWVPYPVNCTKQVQFWPEFPEDKAFHEIFAAKATLVEPIDKDDGESEFHVRFDEMVVDGIPVTLPMLRMKASYNGQDKSAKNVKELKLLIRQQFLPQMRSQIQDYSSCEGSIKKTKFGTDLILSIGTGQQERNACVLDKMAAFDRAIYTGIAKDFDKMLAKGGKKQGKHKPLLDVLAHLQ